MLNPPTVRLWQQAPASSPPYGYKDIRLNKTTGALVLVAPDGTETGFAVPVISGTPTNYESGVSVGTVATVPTFYFDGTSLWLANSNTATEANWRQVAVLNSDSELVGSFALEDVSGTVIPDGQIGLVGGVPRVGDGDIVEGVASMTALRHFSSLVTTAKIASGAPVRVLDLTISKEIVNAETGFILDLTLFYPTTTELTSPLAAGLYYTDYEGYALPTSIPWGQFALGGCYVGGLAAHSAAEYQAVQCRAALKFSGVVNYLTILPYADTPVVTNAAFGAVGAAAVTTKAAALIVTCSEVDGTGAGAQPEFPLTDDITLSLFVGANVAQGAYDGADIPFEGTIQLLPIFPS